jgi:hypothetical protein
MITNPNRSIIDKNTKYVTTPLTYSEPGNVKQFPPLFLNNESRKFGRARGYFAMNVKDSR